MVLDIGQQDGPKPKCYFTHATLPTYIDNANPPTKKEPFRTTLEQQFSHTLTLLLPSSSAQQALHDKLTTRDGDGTIRYARVYMKPVELITGDFFNSYIKTGNVVMLSEGRAGTDTVFSLCDGILRFEVDKPTFEKLGLEGKAVGSEGRKHVKARFSLEYNLRLPNMVRGKKAFDRLHWAFQNVLSDSLAWLFHDLRSPTENGGALGPHAPAIKVLPPRTDFLTNVLCLSFPETTGEDEREEAAELLEWLGMTMARSPRVMKGDDVDPFLCRYRPAGQDEGAMPKDLVIYQWRGFVPAAFAVKVLLAALKASTTEDGWFALGATAFQGSGYTVMKKEGEVMTWNYAD
ncbi:hypothetical protein Q7P37_001332 [Cladosporium fusiforme]